MEFIKKNYEKALLGLVLLGLALAVGFLPFKIASEREKLEALRNRFVKPNVPAMPELNLGRWNAILERASTPLRVNFSEPNKLFNPMPWLLDRENRLIPSTKVGPTFAVVTNITPLYLIISLDRVATVPDLPANYVITVEKQAAAAVRDRSKRSYFCKAGEKKDIFTLVEVQGPADDPTKLVIQLNDTAEQGSITKDTPFRREDGYKATILYPPEKLVRTELRVGSVIAFNFERYEIARIARDEVVLIAASNQKKWPIKYNPAP